MMALRIVIDALLVIGAFFALAGTLGVLKMPDTFCRMQASTCITTLGMLGVAIGGLLVHGLVVLPTLLFLLAGHPPGKFFRRIQEALLTAFATCSSSAMTSPFRAFRASGRSMVTMAMLSCFSNRTV